MTVGISRNHEGHIVECWMRHLSVRWIPCLRLSENKLNQATIWQKCETLFKPNSFLLRFVAEAVTRYTAESTERSKQVDFTRRTYFKGREVSFFDRKYDDHHIRTISLLMLWFKSTTPYTSDFVPYNFVLLLNYQKFAVQKFEFIGLNNSRTTLVNKD